MALTQVSTGGIKDGQVQTADLADGQVTVGKLHADALDHTYTLGASGTDHYTFTGEGLTGAVNDPTLYLTRGKTYRFVNGNSAGAHPFRIQTTVNGSAGTEYNTGVTNNGGAGGSTIVFEVPHAAPDVLYYQCTSHGSMGGILYVTGALADGTVTEAKIVSGAVTQGKLANNAVTTNKIAVDAINNSHISNNSVNTAEIYDEAITLAKLEHGTSSNDGKFLRANNGADPSFETVTSTTINNNADNRVITGSGTANTLEGESNATFDGTKFSLTPPKNSNNDGFEVIPAGGTTASSFKVLGNNNAGADGRNGGVVNIDANYYAEASTIFSIAGRGTNRFSILGSGIVTKPYQPSFHANSGSTYWTHGSSTGTLDIDTVTTELFDVGGNYNASTCVFTAPVAGKYFFTFTYAYVCTSGYLNIHLKKGVSGTYSTYGKMFASPPQQSSAYSGHPVTGIMELAAGNTVKPMAELNYAGNQIVNVSFTGYLIG
tara:strand:- start:134 stop:1597 length:1464 start_codon:yes stop_codon:yes gene_type:complete